MNDIPENKEKVESNQRHETKSWFRTEFIVAFAAIVVSIATLFVYIYQARIMQNQLHTSVWPYLEWLYNKNEGEFYITIENKGIGPAIIKSATVKLDGEKMEDNFQLFKKVLGSTDFRFMNSTVEGRVMSPGETIQLFHIYDSAKAQAFDSLTQWSTAPHKFELSICFCSVYGDCWTTTGLDITEAVCK